MKRTLLAAWAFMAASCAQAADTDQLIGVWKLISYERKILETGEVERTLGSDPIGYLTYTPKGHVSAVLYGKERPKPKGDVPTEQEALVLFKTTIASYVGTY